MAKHQWKRLDPQEAQSWVMGHEGCWQCQAALDPRTVVAFEDLNDLSGFRMEKDSEVMHPMGTIRLYCPKPECWPKLYRDIAAGRLELPT